MAKKSTITNSTPTKTATKRKTAEPQVTTKPKEDLVVFAFRLTEAERTAIHKTAGPANASRFIRRVAVAFANEDESAFKAVLAEARA